MCLCLLVFVHTHWEDKQEIVKVDRSRSKTSVHFSVGFSLLSHVNVLPSQ